MACARENSATAATIVSGAAGASMRRSAVTHLFSVMGLAHTGADCSSLVSCRATSGSALDVVLLRLSRSGGATGRLEAAQACEARARRHHVVAVFEFRTPTYLSAVRTHADLTNDEQVDDRRPRSLWATRARVCGVFDNRTAGGRACAHACGKRAATMSVRAFGVDCPHLVGNNNALDIGSTR